MTLSSKKRIEALLFHLKKSKNAVGVSIGDKNGMRLTHVVSGRNEISEKLASDMVETYPNINYQWLLHGSGSMLNNIDQDSSNVNLVGAELPEDVFENKNGNRFVELKNGKFRVTVKKIPVKAYGSYLSDFQNIEFLEEMEDVFLEKQRYRVLIKKGKQYKWVERVIKDVAIDFWIKSLYGAKKGDFIFSIGLKPGIQRIRREQIDRRWRVHVKNKLGITADIYSLKHSNLDETAEILSIKDAAAMASHTSTKMVEKHYAVGETGRQLMRLQSVNNNFS